VQAWEEEQKTPGTWLLLLSHFLLGSLDGMADFMSVSSACFNALHAVLEILNTSDAGIFALHRVTQLTWLVLPL
jgi:hypothetical protein